MTINILPVRRNGARESRKENIESAEIAAIDEQVRAMLASLVTAIQQTQTQIAEDIEIVRTGEEATVAQTEIRG